MNVSSPKLGFSKKLYIFNTKENVNQVNLGTNLNVQHHKKSDPWILL